MFAIIETGSKQYKVTENLILDVEKLDLQEQKTISFDKVLLLSPSETDPIVLGKPYVEGATVEASVLEDMIQDDKIIVFKFKRKTGYKKTQGHRQQYTRVKITKIVHKGA